MNIKEEGSRVAQLEDGAKKDIGGKLVAGSINISDYTTGVCYDTVAFTRFMLLSKKIKPKDLTSKSGQQWLSIFNFDKGTQWKGKGMKKGQAVGFWRLADKKFFHAAIATADGKVRAVNGNTLGNGWAEANLKTLLGKPDEEGQFDFDRTKIKVWISKV